MNNRRLKKPFRNFKCIVKKCVALIIILLLFGAQSCRDKHTYLRNVMFIPFKREREREKEK